MAISVGGAVGAGFSLIGRRPLTVFGWGAMLLVAAIIVQLLAYLIFGFQAATTAPVAPGADMSRIFQQAGGQMANSLGRGLFAFCLQLPLTVLISGALMRSILEPDYRGFASMRVGGQEGALLLLYLLYIPIGIVVFLIWALGLGACIALGAALSQSIGAFGAWTLAVLLMIAFGLAFMWFALRFSLAGPMTFAERRVRFFGSWTATRGEGWRLFGLAWLLILIAIGLLFALGLLFMIFAVVVFGAMAGAAGGMTALQQNPAAAMATMGPLAVVMLLVGAVIYAMVIGCGQAIFAAPFAEAYRQLRGSPDVSATFT